MKYLLPLLPEETRAELERRVKRHKKTLEAIKRIPSGEEFEEGWPLRLELALPYIAAEVLVTDSKGSPLPEYIDREKIDEFFYGKRPWEEAYITELVKNPSFLEIMAKRIAVYQFNSECESCRN